MKKGNKKNLSLFFSWGFLLFSIVIPYLVPEVRERITNFGIGDIYKYTIGANPLLALFTFSFLAAVFALMYLIDLYKKHRGYSNKVGISTKEAESALTLLRIMMFNGRIYAVVLGLIILIARFAEYIFSHV